MRVQIERLFTVLTEHPREDRILHEIVERATRHLVELRQIVKVVDATFLPQLLYSQDVLTGNQTGEITRYQDVIQLISILNKTGCDSVKRLKI